jgi:TRAP-type C4-dicarboxylate transport system permease small subunit
LSAGCRPRSAAAARPTGVNRIPEGRMSATKLIAIAIIVAGILALIYGSFTYTKETHEADLGAVELSVQEKETVNIPVWAGVAAIVVGGALLLFGDKRRI